MVEREPFTSAGIAVCHTVANDDAGVTEPVVVAVNRPDTVVLRGDIGGRIDNVLPEFVVGKGSAQQGHGVEFDLCGKGNDRVVPASFGGFSNGDRTFAGAQTIRSDLNVGEFAGA